MSISTLSFNTSTRVSLQRLQTQLNDATQELNSGRHVDVGRTLGRLTGASVSARANENSFKEQQTSNTLVADRLSNIDASLATISEGSEALANVLIGSGVATNYTNVVSQAKSGLQQLTGALNATSSGQYLFGGDRTDEAPVATYDTSPLVSNAQQATKDSLSAFVAAATGGTDVSLVSATDLKAYLTTGYVDTATPPVTHKFDDLFNDVNWAANWSSASSATIESKISKTETITSSASANDKAFRDTASAYTLLADIGIEKLGADAKKVVTDVATSKLKGAGDQVTSLRADIGVKQTRVDASNAELQRQQDIMKKTVSNLEEVDITEAGLRVNALKTQLDSAYAVTGKLQNLSILDYI